MKPRIRCSIISAGGLIGSLALIPATPLAAIEPPPEEATPPAALLQEEATPRPAKQPDASPFMGVVTAEVPAMLADHLGLSDGNGVIIRTIVPASPAEKAGLSVNDILTALDGNPITNSEAFSSAIRNRKAGDLLKIDLIHKGKPTSADVKLTERPADIAAQMDAEPYLGGIPRIHADRLRGLIERNRGAFGPSDLGAAPEAQFEDRFRQMRDRMNRAFGDDAAPGEGIGFQQNSTIRLMDGDGSVEINSSGGDTRVKVRDRNNNTVWSGPWNTEEEKAAAPDDIRGRIDRIKAGEGTGFSFRFGNSRGNPDTIDN